MPSKYMNYIIKKRKKMLIFRFDEGDRFRKMGLSVHVVQPSVTQFMK